MTLDSETQTEKAKQSERFEMRTSKDFIEKLDDLRRWQPHAAPTRAEMVRIVVEQIWREKMQETTENR